MLARECRPDLAEPIHHARILSSPQSTYVPAQEPVGPLIRLVGVCFQNMCLSHAFEGLSLTHVISSSVIEAAGTTTVSFHEHAMMILFMYAVRVFCYSTWFASSATTRRAKRSPWAEQ